MEKPFSGETDNAPAKARATPTLTEPPTKSRSVQPVQTATSGVSGSAAKRRPSYSPAARKLMNVRQRWRTNVSPTPASWSRSDTATPLELVPTKDQSDEPETSSVGLPRR